MKSNGRAANGRFFEARSATGVASAPPAAHPLTYEFEGWTEIAIGSLDDPERAPPTVQVNADSRCSFFNGLSDLPEKSEVGKRKDEAWNVGVVSNQHPDRDM